MTTFATATTIDDAVARRGGRRTPRCRRHRPRRRRAPGQGAAARVARRDPPRRGAARDRARRPTGLRLGALVTPCGDRGGPARDPRLTRRWPTRRAIVGSHATRAQGTLGGNLMNASPAMETGGPLVVLRRDGDAASRGGHARGRRGRAVHRPGRDRSQSGDELLVAVDVPHRLRGTGSAYVRLEYRRQMEIAVVGATAVVTLDGDTVTAGRASRSRRSRRRSAVCRRPRRRSRARPRPLTTSRLPLPPRPRQLADLRRARLGAVSPSDGRGDRTPRDRRGAHASARRRAFRSRRAGAPVKVAATLDGQRHLVPGGARSGYDAACRGP